MADQTVRMCMHVCAFIVPMKQNPLFHQEDKARNILFQI